MGVADVPFERCSSCFGSGPPGEGDLGPGNRSHALVVGRSPGEGAKYVFAEWHVQKCDCEHALVKHACGRPEWAAFHQEELLK